MPIFLFAMPTSSLALLFSVVVGLANAMPGPGPAVETLVYRADEWSPRPTAVPEDPSKLFKRDSVDVAICGWSGGNLALPASCDSRSSCVHDTVHGIIGCCATSGPCTQGVYTTCLDSKSSGWLPAPTQVNDGVTMCPANSQCYKNMYPGQYSQYTCGDPASATTISTAYIGQSPDVRLQVVYTGVTFSPTAVAGGGGSITAATATGLMSAGGLLPVSTAKTLAQPPTGSKANAGTVAGGTVAGVAGVALVGAFAFFCLRRRNKTNRTRRSGSGFFERKDAFGQHEPVRQNYNPDEYVSPLTGHPDNARGFDGAFNNDTAYHGGGGMTGSHHGGVGRPSPAFSTIAGRNSFANEEPAPPLPTGPHRYTDVSRHNPFSDRHEFGSAPKPLSEREFADQSNQNTPSPQPQTPPREQATLLVNEIDNQIDDFSRSWSERTREGSFYQDNSDDDSDGDQQLHTATSVPIPQGRSVDREAQSEALRQTDHQNWNTPYLRTVRSDISSMHNGAAYHQARNITAPVPGRYQTHVASNSSVSSYRGTPTPATQAAAALRPIHPLEQEQNLLDEPTISRDRFDSEDTTYSENPDFSRNSSSRSPLRPIPPPNFSERESVRGQRMSFGLNGAISEVISGSDGWRGSGINGEGWSPAWSGIGGGWLEGQSGMAMTTVEEDKETAAGPHELPDTPLMRSSGTQRGTKIKRRPVSEVPISNSPGLLHTERGETMRKGTFGALHENER